MLPPADVSSNELEGALSDDSSSRCLDDVGAVTVLEAMVEQRRRWSTIPPAHSGDDADSDAIATQKRERIAPNDDVFQKIR